MQEQMTRATLLRRAAAAGMSLPAMSLLAACGGGGGANAGGNDKPGPLNMTAWEAYPDQIREYVHAAGRRYVVLGTDGFGRSDYRVKLRKFFEVDRHYVVVAALKALADDGAIKPAVVAEAIAKYQIDAGRSAPWTV